MAENLETSLLLDFHDDMLTDRQCCVIEYHYNGDLSLTEIADNGGITWQGVHDSIRQAESQPLGMEERLGLTWCFREMREGLRRIRDVVERTRIYNSQSIFSRDMQQGVSLIEGTARRLCEGQTKGFEKQWHLKDWRKSSTPPLKI